MPTELPGNTLSYFPPDPGRSISVRVPESHCVFIGPFACGRRHAVRAIEDGDGAKVSFLNISEGDAVAGSYEEIIGDAIEKLLALLRPCPRALLLYFNCIDDFLGTDEGALMAALRQRFPDQPLACCRIDPVALGQRIMPGMVIQSRLYSFLRPAALRDSGVNIISPGQPLRPESELWRYLEQWGAEPIRQLADCQTFDAYQEMAQSRLNLVLSFMGELAAQDMGQNIGLPYLCRPIGIRPEETAGFYQELARCLGQPRPDFSPEIGAVEEDLARTKKTLAGIRLVVDSSVDVNPFSLGRMLLSAGFTVTQILAMRIREQDAADVAWLREKHPETVFRRAHSYEYLTQEKVGEDCLVLGADGAYVLGARRWVDIRSEDDDYFGFQGVHKILALLRQACLSPLRPGEEEVSP